MTLDEHIDLVRERQGLRDAVAEAAIERHRIIRTAHRGALNDTRWTAYVAATERERVAVAALFAFEDVHGDLDAH